MAEEIKADTENDEVEYVHCKGHVTNLDEFEDDGFVVMEADEEEDYENDYESEDETNDEEGVCCLCQDGGYLIVCDGGDNLEGCGRNFHLRCINRNAVPPGDWVCQTCASSFKPNVGIEGHEFPIEGEEDGGDVTVEEEKEADGIVGPSKGRLKRKRNNTREEYDDDSDDEAFEAVVSSRPVATQRICGDESDGSLVVLPQQNRKGSKQLFMWESDDE
jgi:RecJ-like exonuclease